MFSVVKVNCRQVVLNEDSHFCSFSNYCPTPKCMLSLHALLHIAFPLRQTRADCAGQNAWLSECITTDPYIAQQHGSTSHYRVNYRAKTIGYDSFPIVRLSPDAIVRWDYRPNPTCHWITQNLRHIGILLLVSITTMSPQWTLSLCTSLRNFIEIGPPSA